MAIDEEVIEAAFWHFVTTRTRTGAERDAFKAQVRAVLRAHMASLERLLAEAEIYVRAYQCQCDAPEGIPGASRLLRKITTLTTRMEG